MNSVVIAEDLMSRPVRKLTADTPVSEAAAFLLRWGISGAPVLNEHGQPVGVFTLNDIARHVQNRLVNLPTVDPSKERTLEGREAVPRGFHVEAFEGTTVGDLMTFGLVTVFPQATLEEVVRSMTTQKIHRVFVLSDDGELDGVITSMDVLKWMERQYRSVRTAHAS
jgi:CBS domain-containing protein